MRDRSQTELAAAQVALPRTEAQIEALSREVERLSVIAARERGLLEVILEHSPHGIIVSNAEGKLILQNKAAEAIWAGSASAENVAGWGKYRAFHADGRPFEGKDWSMARALTNKETTQAEEIRFQRFDDSRGVMIGSSAPLFRSNGELEGALSVFVDITKVKEQEAELQFSNQRFLTTLKSIGDAVIATDGFGKITFMNPIAEKLTRWSQDNAIGKSLAQVFRIVNEETRTVIESPVDQVIREGKLVGPGNHSLLITRDGTEVAIDDSGAPIYDSNGSLVGVVLVFRDVSEKRREEQRRRFITEAATILSSSLDYVPTLTKLARLAVPTLADWCAVDMVGSGNVIERLAVAHVDPEKVQWAKEIAKRYPPDPTSLHGVHEVIRSGKSVLIQEIPDAFLANVAVDEEHLRLIRLLGVTSYMVVPLRCRGVTLGAIAFVSSESNRRFSTEDLAFAEDLANVAAFAIENARLYHNAQHANRAKDEFLATASHELRTPLNAILGWARLLRAGEVPPDKVARALDTIERNSLVQVELIDDLLDVSRIISGKLRLDVQTVSVTPVIEGALESIQHALQAKDLHFHHVIDANVGPLYGDPQRIQQVIWNLLSNAVKFTPKGGTVRLTVEQVESNLTLSVTDSGQGIPTHLLSSIFERFQQADGSAARVHGGLGLGLTIVRHIVELHGGSIEACSEGEGRGATFIVRLPVSPSVNHPVSGPFRQPSIPGGKSHIEHPKELQGLTVLVVDDETDSRELLSEVLQRCGCLVLNAASAAEGLAVLDRASPRILVCDIGMPGMDGYAFIEQVRMRPADKGGRTMAVALTAYTSAEDRRRALRAGFQMHMGKPVDPVEFISVLGNVAQLAVAMS